MAEIDERLTNVENEKQEALTEVENTYGGMISQSDKYFQGQIDAVEKWGDKQADIQNQQTDFAIDKIEQQKEWAQKDYTKEQSGAYKDWQKQSNPYGANAESMAAQGMANTGYAESSQVAMYNQYQTRVATARESFVRAKQEYDNAMTEARLQNSAALAQIAAETLQKKLELSLQGFQYKNQLITEKVTAKRQVDMDYWGRYTDVLNQINQENALAETKRHNQAQESVSERSIALQERQFQWEKEQANKSSGGGTIKKSGGSSGGSSSGSDKGDRIAEEKGWIDGKNSSNKKELNTATPALDSILALGYGPISAKKLDSLVRSGEVQEIERDGKLYYRRVFKP